MDGYGADEAYAKSLGLSYQRPESGVECAEREDYERRMEIEKYNQPSNSQLMEEIKELKNIIKNGSVDLGTKDEIIEQPKQETTTVSRFMKSMVGSDIFRDLIDIQTGMKND